VKGETFIGSWLVICYDDAIEEYLLARKLSGEDDGTMAEFREAYEKHGGARFSRKTTTTRTGTVDRMACSHISNRLPLRTAMKFECCNGVAGEGSRSSLGYANLDKNVSGL